MIRNMIIDKYNPFQLY